MFRDECELEVVAGRGGDGMLSFRREKYVPRGGPDGGDGGKGGDVVLLATTRLNSLLALGRKRLHRAKNGRPGETARRSGAMGEELVLEVPVGTQVYDLARGNLLRDLAEDGQRLVIARGGGGGRGNAHFASAVQQAPRRSEGGREGERREVRLELKLMAEVGLVGLPNAGKSTLLSRVSQARPKVADYPFTTLEPHVGIAAVGDWDSIVLADLPGLIEGASEGHGLGHRFLRHVERCQVLLHLVDVSGEPEEALQALEVIEGELAAYSPALAQRERVLVASKVESEESERTAAALEEQAGRPVLRISAHTGQGVQALLERARALVRGEPEDF